MMSVLLWRQRRAAGLHLQQQQQQQLRTRTSGAGGGNGAKTRAPGEDEEWSDSEKTPSVSSGGVEGGGGSALSSPTGAGAQLVDDELVALPPPPRLNATSAADTPADVRLRLSVQVPTNNEDSRKRLFTDEYPENSRTQQRKQPSRPNSVLDSSPKSERLDDDAPQVAPAEESRTSSSSSSSANSQRRTMRRDSCADGELEVKRSRLDDELLQPATAAPRLRLNASLATDPALRPQAVAALTIKPEPRAVVSPGPNPPLSAALQNAIATGRLFVLPNDIGKDGLTEAVAATAPRPTALICPPCGIRFSSASTLDAHQKYYCSHRPRLESDAENNDDDDEKSASGGGPNSGNNTGGKFDTRKAYACPHCSYSADKKVSLNRHMRMHAASPVQPAAVMPVVPVAAQPNPAANTSSNGALNEEAERYCQNCDIRFSSLKTYRAHKAHYCSTRHVVKDGLTTTAASSSGASASSLKGSPPTSSSPGDSPPPSASSSQPQPCLALPTNPILIVPVSLVRGASVLAAPGLLAPNTPCFLLPNGTLQPMTRGLDAGPMPQMPTAVVPQVIESPSSVLRAANKPITPGPIGPMTPNSPNSAASAPLDLSVRKSPDHEKENRVSPLSSSLPPPPGSPRSRGSGSPRARSLSGSGQTVDRIQSTPPTELALRLAELPPPSVPGVLVKQGVSRCKECNIVFCRHENFVAHKKHYCQARESSVTSPPPPGTPSPPLVQLICAACGIKFASMDNLVAHQAFYCPKRPESQDHHSRCPKCKTVIEPGVAHTCSSPQTGGWRCPVCNAVSPTAGAAQRHMDSHQNVKAFRCIICKYKGNTLRGMRTHIRMHFEKRGADLQEEKFIACVTDDDMNTPTPEPAPATTPEEITSDPQRINGKSEPSITPRKSPQPPASPAISPAPSPAIGAGGKVKQEPFNEADTASPQQQQQPPKSVTPDGSSALNDATKKGLQYCKSCDISFQFLHTFRAHKQFYCSSHAGEASNNNINNNINNNSAATTPATPATTPPTSGRTEASVL